MSDLNDGHDELQELLARGEMESPDRLHEKILHQSRPVLRRRRWTRGAVKLSGFAACFLAGMLTMHWLKAPTEKAITENVPEVKEHTSKESSAVAREWEAFDKTDKRGETYREAGDLYLQDHDYDSALRCYRQALDSPSVEQSVSTDSSWLLLALKHAREEE